MIRQMLPDDLFAMTLNEYVDLSYIESLQNVLALYESWTLIRDGVVRAIIFYRNYTENNYEGFFICSVDIDSFDAKELSGFITYIQQRLHIKRIETVSLDCDTLNRWHEFLGFTCEGVKRKFAKGRDYRMWAIISED